MTNFPRRSLVAFPVALLAGCLFKGGGGSESDPPPPAELPPSEVPPDANRSTIAYVIGRAGQNLTAFSADRDTGALTQLAPPVPAGIQPFRIAIDPTGRVAYVGDIAGYNVLSYRLNDVTGTPTPVQSSTVQLVRSVAVHPSGMFVYAADDANDRIWIFTINAAGSLEPQGSVFLGASPYHISIHPTGRFLFVAQALDDGIGVYRVNEFTGAPSEIPGARVNLPPGSRPSVMAIDPAGQFIYVGNVGDSANTVSAFSIASDTGALSAAGTLAADPEPGAIAIHPSGKFVYVANADGNSISAYTVVSGALMSIGTFEAGTMPTGVAVDPTGKFVYVANELDHTISIFDIDPSGGVLASRGQPFALPNQGPMSILMIEKER